MDYDYIQHLEKVESCVDKVRNVDIAIGRIIVIK